MWRQRTWSSMRRNWESDRRCDKHHWKEVKINFTCLRAVMETWMSLRRRTLIKFNEALELFNSQHSQNMNGDKLWVVTTNTKNFITISTAPTRHHLLMTFFVDFKVHEKHVSHYNSYYFYLLHEKAQTGSPSWHCLRSAECSFWSWPLLTLCLPDLVTNFNYACALWKFVLVNKRRLKCHATMNPSFFTAQLAHCEALKISRSV